MRYPLPEIYPRKTRGHISDTNSRHCRQFFRPGGRPVNDSFTPLWISTPYHSDRSRRKSRLHQKVNKDNGFAPVTNRYGASKQGSEIPYRVSFTYISSCFTIEDRKKPADELPTAVTFGGSRASFFSYIQFSYRSLLLTSDREFFYFTLLVLYFLLIIP